MKSKNIPYEQRKSTIISTYTNINIQNSTNDIRIKLISHTIKIWERVILNQLRLRHGTHIIENQFDFMPRRFAIEASDLLITKIDEEILEKSKRFTYCFYHF